MKSIILIFLLVFSSMFINSCDTTFSNLNKDDYELPNLEEGLGYDIKTSIPYEVYPGENYQFIVKITNLGINDLEELFYSIQASNDVLSVEATGYDNLNDLFKEEKLSKRTYDSPQPKSIFYNNLILRVSNEGVSSDLNHEDVILTSHLKFKSQVSSELEICLKTLKKDIGDTSNEICNQNQFSFNSQASPVQLTKVEIKERSLNEENKTIYAIRIGVDNFDKGSIFNYSVDNEKRLEYEDYGVVILDEVYISNDLLECQKDVLNFNKNEKFFECTYSKELDSTIKTQLYAKIKYGYLLKKEDKVKVIYNLNDD